MIGMMGIIGEPATLEGLAEECSELCQAALKDARVLRGVNPTPVSQLDAERQLLEEMADVEIMLREVAESWFSSEELEAEILRKVHRTRERFREAGLM